MDLNLNLINKDNCENYKIYDISYDKAGYPHFLIYKDGQWVRMSAKHFRPYNEKDWSEMLKNCVIQPL
jgi:hypothetical protein